MSTVMWSAFLLDNGFYLQHRKRIEWWQCCTVHVGQNEIQINIFYKVSWNTLPYRAFLKFCWPKVKKKMKFFPRFPCGVDGRAVYGHVITTFSFLLLTHGTPLARFARGALLSTLFVISPVLSAKVFPEWTSNPVLGTQKTCPFPLNRGVPSLDVTDSNITRIIFYFFWNQFWVPSMEVPLE